MYGIDGTGPAPSLYTKYLVIYDGQRFASSPSDHSSCIPCLERKYLDSELINNKRCHFRVPRLPLPARRPSALFCISYSIGGFVTDCLVVCSIASSFDPRVSGCSDWVKEVY